MKSLLIVLCLLSLSGCATLDKGLTGQNTMPDEAQRKALVAEFTEFTPAQKVQFIEGNAWIGMNQKQLNALWGGEPKRKQNKLTSAGPEETQLYAVRVGNWKTGIVTKYFKVKMTGGKLTEMQELDKDVGSFDKL